MSQSKFRLVRTTTSVASIALTMLCLLAAPAAARQDRGSTPVGADVTSELLARVGTQYVVGDVLTGNAVLAPAWIPELP